MLVHVRRSTDQGNGLCILDPFDKLAAAPKNWSRLAIYADRGVIVLNKPPYLVCQGSDVQDGEVSRHRLVFETLAQI